MNPVSNPVQIAVNRDSVVHAGFHSLDTLDRRITVGQTWMSSKVFPFFFLFALLMLILPRDIQNYTVEFRKQLLGIKRWDSIHMTIHSRASSHVEIFHMDQVKVLFFFLADYENIHTHTQYIFIHFSQKCNIFLFIIFLWLYPENVEYCHLLQWQFPIIYSNYKSAEFSSCYAVKNSAKMTSEKLPSGG